MSRSVITARQIARDLDELVNAGKLEPLVAINVRQGFAAIADQIRDLRGTGRQGAMVTKHDVLGLVDPAWMDETDFARLAAGDVAAVVDEGRD